MTSNEELTAEQFKRMAIEWIEAVKEGDAGMDNWQIERRKGFIEAKNLIRDGIFFLPAKKETNPHPK